MSVANGLKREKLGQGDQYRSGIREEKKLDSRNIAGVDLHCHCLVEDEEQEGERKGK